MVSNCVSHAGEGPPCHYFPDDFGLLVCPGAKVAPTSTTRPAMARPKFVMIFHEYLRDGSIMFTYFVGCVTEVSIVLEHIGNTKAEPARRQNKCNIFGYLRSANHEPCTKHGGGKAEGEWIR